MIAVSGAATLVTMTARPVAFARIRSQAGARYASAAHVTPAASSAAAPTTTCQGAPVSVGLTTAIRRSSANAMAAAPIRRLVR